MDKRKKSDSNNYCWEHVLICINGNIMSCWWVKMDFSLEKELGFVL